MIYVFFSNKQAIQNKILIKRSIKG